MRATTSALLIASLLSSPTSQAIAVRGWLRPALVGPYPVHLLPTPAFASSSSRLFCSSRMDEDDYPFVRPKDVIIPMDKLDFNFARSSGPGGQNVNKVNTKAEIRFHVASADWIAGPVKQRLLQQCVNKISKDGELIITSQEHRTQSKNKDDCINKLKEMIAFASVEPKEREMWEGLSDKTKHIRKEEKRKRGEVKSMRRMKNSKDWDD